MNAVHAALAIIGIVVVGLLLTGIYYSACRIVVRRNAKLGLERIEPVSQIGTGQQGGFVHDRIGSR